MSDRERVSFLLNRCKCTFTDKHGHDHEIWSYGSLDRAMKAAGFTDEEDEDESEEDEGDEALEQNREAR